MIIRKLMNFKGQHIVRNCSSERCKYSIHGHSYVVELFFTSNGLDEAGMVLDFGLMKGTIKDLIGSFDNAYSIWNKESDDFKDFIYENHNRWISMPVSPSAENYSLMLFYIINEIINATEFNNGEKEVQLKSVRVHETDTGYAEAFREDLKYWNFNLYDITFSEQVKSKWTDPKMYDKLIQYNREPMIKPFVNPMVQKQI